MKNEHKLLTENIAHDLLLHFNGLSEKSAVKLIHAVNATAIRLVKKFYKLTEQDRENATKKESKLLKKEAKKQKKAVKKAEQNAKISIVTSIFDEDVIQESTKI